MARKQLIKGTNALRVEERIARVPADLQAEGDEDESGAEGIFRALKNLEDTKAKPQKESLAPEKKQAPAQAQAKRIGPSDFSAAERAAIVASCLDYRNRLPIYLQSVQAELRVLDAVIAKCEAAGRSRP